MSIARGLFRVWTTATLLSFCVAAASYFLLQHLPAAKSAGDANIYIPLFLAGLAAPFALGAALTALGLALGVLRWIWRTVHPAPGRLRAARM